MSAVEWRRIRVDWEELREAFEDSSSDHRYYLDRETGAVHFFSEYLDNEDEQEDERILAAEERYVQVPRGTPAVGDDRLSEFVATLAEGTARRALAAALRAPDGATRFHDAVELMPAAQREWRRFAERELTSRIESWLHDVSVEPL